ncbi:MAG: hypothetical protein V4438_01485, partial [Patescibacteria group bacterium]
MPQKSLKTLLAGISAALIMEDIFPHVWRRFALHLFGGISTLLLGLTLLQAGEISERLRGGFLLSLALTLFFASL